MTTFAPFTQTRKALIADLKAMLTDPENLRIPRNEYGNKLPRLFFKDYVVYAVLRGADWKKTSHLEDGANALEILQGLQRSLKAALAKQEVKVPHDWARYVKDASVLAEVEQLLATALAS